MVKCTLLYVTKLLIRYMLVLICESDTYFICINLYLKSIKSEFKKLNIYTQLISIDSSLGHGKSNTNKSYIRGYLTFRRGSRQCLF